MTRPHFSHDRPFVEMMEERILHSADLASLVVGTGTLATDLSQPAALAAQVQQAAAAEIAFVDLSLPDAAGLVADLRQQQAAGRPIEVVTIGVDEDGLAVMSDALAGRSGLSAVHVLAHGSDGRLQLGASVLDAQLLLQRAPEVAEWSSALAPSADLLLYGCDLAETEVGQSLVQDIAALTGADVAASTDLTGAAERGGDWTLEYTTGGPIHATSAVTAAEQASWRGLMATYRVTSLADNGAAGTLRWAIDQANANAGADTIVIDVAGTITIRANGRTADDTNARGDFDISDTVAIVGKGVGQTVIDGAGRDRLFDVRSGTTTLSGMTVQNGTNQQGGGLRVAQGAALSLDTVTVQNNVSNASGKGGGIYTDGALTLRNTRVQNNGNNLNKIDGAGIHVDAHGSLYAVDSEISGNRAGNTGDGGGLWVDALANATLERVTIANNQARNGGGINNLGFVTASNLTLSNNTARLQGGGAFTVLSNSLVLNHATVADNSASDGGGLFNLSSGVVASNSLFANNGGGNSHSTVNSQGYNLSTDGTLGLSGAGDRNDTPVTLSALANNGGFGRTRALASSNPAVNAADPNDGVLTDQRGVGRSGRADIGAYEYTSQKPTITPIADRLINEDSSTGAISFTIADPDSNVDDLVVSATADDGRLLPASSLVLGGSGAARTISITPPPNANGRTVVQVSVSDPDGNVTSTRFTVTVNPVEDPPTVPDYDIRTNEDTAVSGQVQGSDADGDPLTYGKGSDPAHGSVTMPADGRWTYTPAANYKGNDSFTVVVDDGQGGRATSTVRLTVAPVNDAPTISNYVLTTNEDTAFSGQVQGSDVDGDALTYSKGSDPSHGTVTVQSDGRLTYTPAANYNGADSFTVVVDDGKGGRATSTISVTVTPVNDAPTISNYVLTTNEDTAFSGQVQGSDVDGDALTYSKGSDPSHGTVTVQSDGRLTYTPAANYNGADSFTVVVDDGKVGRATSTISVTVTPVNDAPTISNYVLTTNEDTDVSGQVQGSDVDGDALTYSKGSDPSHGTVTVQSDGRLTYTPAANYNGADSFTVVVDDGKGGRATSTISVTVTPVNDAPTVGNDSQLTDYETPVSGLTRGSDVDGDPLSYAKGSDPSHGSVAVQADGRWTYTPAAGYSGGDRFTVTVSDGNGSTATSTIDIRVRAPNEAPTAPDDRQATDEDTPVSGQVRGSDPDGDPLGYAKGRDPAHGSVTVDNDGRWTYSPGRDYNGTDSFTVLVTDGLGGTATSTVTIDVRPVNDAPTAGDDAARTDEDTTVSGQVQGSDVDGDSLSYAKGSDPRNGTAVVAADGRWTYTPKRDFNGNDSFTVVVSDGNGGTATSTVRITVTPLNDPPTAPDYTAATNEDIAVSGQVQGSDVDGDRVGYSKGSDPSHGSVTVAADGRWTYTPAANYNGADSFTVLVDDGNGGRATSTVRLDIAPVNDVPTAPDYSATTNEDTAVSGQVQGSDVDGDPQSYSKGGDPRSGSVVVGSDGRWTYTPNQDFNGNDSFTVVVSDGNGGTATSTVRIAVAPVNDAPTVPDYNVSTAEDLAVTGQVTGSDVDGDTLTYAKGGDPQHGIVVVAATGAYVYTPSLNYNGADRFTVVVSDGKGGTAVSTVNINVGAVNDAPTVGDDARTTAEDTSVSGQVRGADVDGDALSFAKGSDPRDGLAVVAADGRWTYTPNRDFNGYDSFTVVVSDGNGGTATSTVRITVRPVNDAPTVPDEDVTTAEDTPVSGQVQGADVDGDALSYAKGSDPRHGAVVVAADGRWTYTPNQDFNGSDSFTVAVSDSNGGTAVATVRIVVTPVDDPSLLRADAATTPEDTPVAGNVLDNDSDIDDVLRVASFQVGQAGPAAAGGAVTITGIGRVTLAADGQWQFTADADWNGRVPQITYTTNTGASSTLDITVTPVNDAPVMADTSAATDEDVPLAGRLAATDADGDALTYAKASDPLHGTVVVAPDGRFVYTPDADFNGSDRFDMRASDGQGGNTRATVRLAIAPVNDGPRAGATLTAQQATVGIPFGYTMPANAFVDPDGDNLRYSATLASGAPLPDWLRFDAAIGRFSGTASEALDQPLLVRVRAIDAQGLYADTLMALGVAAGPIQSGAPTTAVAGPPPPQLQEAAPITPLTPEAAPTATPASPATPSAPTAPFASLIVAFPFVGTEDVGGLSLWASRANETAFPVLSLPMEASRWLVREVDHHPGGLSTALPIEEVADMTRPARAMGVEDARRLLDEARQTSRSVGVLRLSVVGASTVAASSLSIGYVFWLLRGGVLASAMLSALPAWQMIDPLPVMAARRDRRGPSRAPLPPGEHEVEQLFDKRDGIHRVHVQSAPSATMKKASGTDVHEAQQSTARPAL